MATVTALGSSPQLAFLAQVFVLGTALGMIVALVRSRQTGSLDAWPLHVAYGALFGLAIGLLIVILDAVTST